MRENLVPIMLAAAAMMLAGCVPGSQEMPEDFSLSFSWNTGSLPPAFRYDYVITIGPGPQGEFDYVPGYGGDDENRWVTPLEISTTDLLLLFDYFQERNFFNTDWETGPESVGGSTTSIILTAFGEETRVPSISTLEGAALSKVKNAQTFIRGFVPQSVWDEMDRRQEAFTAAHSD